MFSTTNKNVLPLTYLSNVIYLFTCECDRRYIGRTTQRLGDRIEQHIPNKLVRTATGTTKPVRTWRSRPVKDITVTVNKGRRKSTPIKPPATVTRRSERLHFRNNALEQAADTGSACGTVCDSSPGREVASGTAAMHNSYHRNGPTDNDDNEKDSAILRHLTSPPACLSAVCKHGTHSHFTIQARARNKSHLAVLEAVYIAKLKPELCVQRSMCESCRCFDIVVPWSPLLSDTGNIHCLTV